MAKKSTDDTRDTVYTYIPMTLDSVCDYEYDEDSFKRGVDYGSYLAGIGTALRNMNADIGIEDIVDILKCVIREDGES